MNLYLLSQSVNNDWDTFDSAVVCARSDEAAKKIHPGENRGYTVDPEDWSRTWADPEHISVVLLGEAEEGIEAGVVLASFNAG